MARPIVWTVTRTGHQRFPFRIEIARDGHPKLPIVFAGNRKLANAWTAQFFEAVDRVADQAVDPQLSLVAEDKPDPYRVVERPVAIDETVRLAALGRSDAFSTAQLGVLFPGLSAARVRRVLEQLVAEGRIEKTGARRGTRWQRIGPAVRTT